MAGCLTTFACHLQAAERFLAQHLQAQLICIGLIGDNWGAKAQAKLEQLPPRFPGRVWCPRNQYAGSDIRDLLWQGADWALCPSRFEPCGLVDIEFGWNGALIIGHNTGVQGRALVPILLTLWWGCCGTRVEPA